MDIFAISERTNAALKAATKTKRGWELEAQGETLGGAIYDELTSIYGPNGIQTALIGDTVTVTWESPAFADIEELHAQIAANDTAAVVQGALDKAAASTTTKHYLVAVCELSAAGEIIGTHHLSSHDVATVDEAKRLAKADTASDWGCDDDEALHVLFVLAVPTGTEIEVIEYDEGEA